MGFLHLSALTDQERLALSQCVLHGQCDALVDLLRVEILAQKHSVQRHFREALNRVYHEIHGFREVDPFRLFDAFALVETRLGSAVFPQSEQELRTKQKKKLKVCAKQDSDFKILEWKTVVCPKCGKEGIIKPVKRKRGYKVMVLYYCYHRTEKKRHHLALNDRVELKKRLTSG